MVDARNERSIAVTRRLGMRLAEMFTTPESEREGHCYRLGPVTETRVQTADRSALDQPLQRFRTVTRPRLPFQYRWG